MSPSVVVATALAVVPMPARAACTPTGIDLTGTWARLQVTTAISTVPVLGEVESKTRGLVLLRASMRETDDFVLEEEICELTNVTAGGVIKTIFPQKFVHALSGRKKNVRLMRDAAGRVRYEELYYVHIGGAHLENPRFEPLPTQSDDPRIVDADEDGHPGLTLEVGGLIGGEIYIVQRDASELSGSFLSPNRIVGRVSWESEQSVVDASPSLLKANPHARPHPSTRANFFRMRRVPVHATCDDVKTRARKLFGP